MPSAKDTALNAAKAAAQAPVAAYNSGIQAVNQGGTGQAPLTVTVSTASVTTGKSTTVGADLGPVGNPPGSAPSVAFGQPHLTDVQVLGWTVRVGPTPPPVMEWQGLVSAWATEGGRLPALVTFSDEPTGMVGNTVLSLRPQQDVQLYPQQLDVSGVDATLPQVTVASGDTTLASIDTNDNTASVLFLGLPTLGEG